MLSLVESSIGSKIVTVQASSGQNGSTCHPSAQPSWPFYCGFSDATSSDIGPASCNSSPLAGTAASSAGRERIRSGAAGVCAPQLCRGSSELRVVLVDVLVIGHVPEAAA